jgi:very-short-patch-repair endonuclease
MNIKQSICSKRRNKLLKTPTVSELLMKKRLEDANIRFLFQKGFIAGDNFCIADFYLPKPYKTVIEIDGDCHLTKKQQLRDADKDLYYNKRGFKIIRILNKDVSTFDLSTLVPIR